MAEQNDVSKWLCPIPLLALPLLELLLFLVYTFQLNALSETSIFSICRDLGAWEPTLALPVSYVTWALGKPTMRTN